MKSASKNKVRLAMVTASLSINGISAVIMNYCTHMDLEQFDISIIAGVPIDTTYRDECKEKGINIVELPAKMAQAGEYYRGLWKSFAGGYEIVHVHGNSAVMAIELFLAYLRGIKIRIAHCHNSTCNHLKLHKLMYPVFNNLYTQGFACSGLAAKWLFREKRSYIIPNAFDIERFRFDEQVRNEIRKQLYIENKFVIGHIGRFNVQKNHPFILKVFQKIAEINPKAYLLLVGDGSDSQHVRELIQEHPYHNRIIDYGETRETEKIYAAMDVFFFPSKHEGLGIALLEAQMNGLPCVSSDVVPQEVIIGDRVKLLSLDEDIEVWKESLLNSKTEKRKDFYKQHIDKIKKYDINGSAKLLENLYLSFLKDNKRYSIL